MYILYIYVDVYIIYICKCIYYIYIRFNNHTRSFRHKRYSTDTELSKYIQKLSNKMQYKSKFSTRLNGILLHVSPYKCGFRRCDLCLTEKLKIIREDPELLLNRRSKLKLKYCCKNKFILANSKQSFLYEMHYYWKLHLY